MGQQLLGKGWQGPSIALNPLLQVGHHLLAFFGLQCFQAADIEQRDHVQFVHHGTSIGNFFVGPKVEVAVAVLHRGQPFGFHAEQAIDFRRIEIRVGQAIFGQVPQHQQAADYGRGLLATPAGIRHQRQCDVQHPETEVRVQMPFADFHRLSL